MARRFFFSLISLLILGMGAFLIPANPAAGQEMAGGEVDLAPYRAVYGLLLDRADFQSGIIGAEGEMVIEWLEECDGWSSSQSLTMGLDESSGDYIEAETRYASWESRDGATMRFNIRNSHNGALSEHYSGVATLKSPNGGGLAEYSVPKGLTIELPEGTIFPTRHLLEMIASAKLGKRVLSRIVFDGATEEGMFEINAVIGSPRKVKEQNVRLDPSLNLSYWPVRLAFFNLDSAQDLPEYETSIHLVANGVSRELILDFGGFVIRAVLDKYEPLEKPAC